MSQTSGYHTTLSPTKTTSLVISLAKPAKALEDTKERDERQTVDTFDGIIMQRSSVWVGEKDIF